MNKYLKSGCLGHDNKTETQEKSQIRIITYLLRTTAGMVSATLDGFQINCALKIQ